MIYLCPSHFTGMWNQILSKEEGECKFCLQNTMKLTTTKNKKPIIVTMNYGEKVNKVIGYAYIEYGWMKDVSTIFVYKKKPAGSNWQKVIITLANKRPSESKEEHEVRSGKRLIAYKPKNTSLTKKVKRI